jgi:hypothetical protein
MWFARTRRPPAVQVDPARVGGMKWGEHRVVHNRRRVVDVDTFRRWRRRTATKPPQSAVTWLNLVLVAITLVAVIGYYRARHPNGHGRPSSSATRPRHFALPSPVTESEGLGRQLKRVRMDRTLLDQGHRVLELLTIRRQVCSPSVAGVIAVPSSPRREKCAPAA